MVEVVEPEPGQVRFLKLPPLEECLAAHRGGREIVCETEAIEPHAQAAKLIDGEATIGNVFGHFRPEPEPSPETKEYGWITVRKIKK